MFSYLCASLCTDTKAVYVNWLQSRAVDVIGINPGVGGLLPPDFGMGGS